MAPGENCSPSNQQPRRGLFSQCREHVSTRAQQQPAWMQLLGRENPLREALDALKPHEVWSYWLWLDHLNSVTGEAWRAAFTSEITANIKKPLETLRTHDKHHKHICYDHLTHLDKPQITACRIIHLSCSCCCCWHGLISGDWEELCEWLRPLLYHGSSSTPSEHLDSVIVQH